MHKIQFSKIQILRIKKAEMQIAFQLEIIFFILLLDLILSHIAAVAPKEQNRYFALLQVRNLQIDPIYIEILSYRNPFHAKR